MTENKTEIKKKKDCMIPSSDSYKGLSFGDWEALNDGKTVKVDEVPAMAKPILKDNKQNNQRKENKLWL